MYSHNKVFGLQLSGYGKFEESGAFRGRHAHNNRRGPSSGRLRSYVTVSVRPTLNHSFKLQPSPTLELTHLHFSFTRLAT